MKLHPKYGVNAHPTVCTRCGKPGDELVMLGSRNKITTCPHCSVQAIGFTPRSKCPKCKKPMSGGKVREIGEREPLPSGLCKDCRASADLAKQVVALGGVFFRCKNCGAQGVLHKDSDIAKRVRAKLGLSNGEPCGAEVHACPACPEAEKENGE
jgi:hypothetical protein